MLTLPVIAMTAFGSPGDQEKILAAGFTSYIKKPAEPVALARQVHEVLRLSN